MNIIFKIALLSTLVPSCWASFVAPTRPRSSMSVSAAAAVSKNDEPDLFEYFDPLLSPHAYPNGISPDQEPVQQQQQQQDKMSPAPRKAFGFRTPSSVQPAAPIESQLDPEENANRPVVDTETTFDPTLSPHEYANGVPDIIVGDADAVYVSQTEKKKSNNKKVGILLMDHGSRNKASNQRLHELARLYEQSLVGDSVVVRAAHMEIASPSIPEGIQQLLDHSVDEIVCHPYFLSQGRHVREDVPRILAETVESLEIDIPITTTDPVGSNTDVMINAIHTLVRKTSTISIKRSVSKE